MTDLSVIILVGNEAVHIRRCLERLSQLKPKQVFVVESQVGDCTHSLTVETARALDWRVIELSQADIPFAQPSLIALPSPTTILATVWHDWPGLYARQFNWALDNLPIASKWILRLDADEYLTVATISKLQLALSDARSAEEAALSDVFGLTLELKRRFCGGEIRHATNGIRLLRIWRRGRGRSEERQMDEHIEVNGAVLDFDGAFYDDNLNTMDWWREKHRGYAKREARDALAFSRGEVHFKRSKELYYRQPPYLRAFLYFVIRYFLKGGFLDGYAGWMWNFWQGLWYRCLVDWEIGKLKRAERMR